MQKRGFVSHFCFDYSVHNGLHRFHFVALNDSFKVLRAMFQGLRHADVQVIVRLLCSQVLQQREKESEQWQLAGEKHTYKSILTITSNLE